MIQNILEMLSYFKNMLVIFFYLGLACISVVKLFNFFIHIFSSNVFFFGLQTISNPYVTCSPAANPGLCKNPHPNPPASPSNPDKYISVNVGNLASHQLRCFLASILLEPGPEPLISNQSIRWLYPFGHHFS